MGMKDVILLEQSQITSGTTWHAAGLMVTFGSFSETSTEIRKYSRDLYSRLEEETGQSTGFKPVGFIELATNEDYLEEYRRISSFNRKLGINVEEISPNEVKKLFPLCNTDDILAGFYVKEDGRVNPVDVTMALSKGARMKGVKVYENVEVIGVTKKLTANHINEQVTGVITSTGHTISSNYVVNCAGMWARQLGEKCGVLIPNQAAEHYYLITEAMDDIDPTWPVIEDPSSYTYIRPEGSGLMVGLFEPNAKAWNTKNIPNHFSFGEIEPDWDRLGPYVEKAMSRVPKTLSTGIKKLFCGPESFTPDLNPIVGESSELINYFVAAGLNSIGILSGGGIGRLLAHWIVHGQPDCDVSKTNGWESPDFYLDKPSDKSASLSEIYNTWQRPIWFDNWRNEHVECRNNFAIFDMSFMSKFIIEGKDVSKALNYLCTSNINHDNTITYTQLLNENGYVQGDVTIAKLTTSSINDTVNIKFSGLKALNSLRLEKGYRDYGHDIDNMDTLQEVGLGFTADYKKIDGFKGKDKTIQQKNDLKQQSGLPNRLVSVLVLDPIPLLYHSEIIYRNDVTVGIVRSGSYGHTLGGAIGLAMIQTKSDRIVINNEYLTTGIWEIEINNKKYPCKVSLKPFYDPTNSRIK
eukprot:gene18008-23646_t